MNAKILLLSFGIIISLTLAMYAILTNIYLSEKLGYSEQQVLNIKGVWEGTYNAAIGEGCIKIDISKMKNDEAYEATITFYSPLNIKSLHANVYVKYQDFDYGTISFVNETSQLFLLGKVKNGEVIVIDGRLRDIEFKRIEIRKFAKICEDQEINEKSAFDETLSQLDTIIPPSCMQKVKENYFLVEGKSPADIVAVSSDPCILLIRNLSRNNIKSQPLYQNESYEDYEDFEIQWLKEGAVVRFK